MINFIYNQKNTFLAISAMVIGVIFIDIHGLIVKYLGGEYSTIQLALFRNTFAIIPLIPVSYTHLTLPTTPYV